MILKQLIRYTNADALEATWVEEVNGQEVVVKCQAYANSQMDLLSADLGDDAGDYTELIAEVAATYVPAPGPTAAEICKNIKAIRDYKTQNGGYRVGTKWYHSDTFSRTQQLGLRLEGDNLATGIMWKTMDGSFVEMTPLLAQQIFSAAVAQDTALFSHAEYLQTLVNVSPEPWSIDITLGWPETFNNV